MELNREANPLDMKAGNVSEAFRGAVATGMDVATIKSKITSVAAVIMGGEDDFEVDTPLMEAGLTSNTAVMLRDELTKDLHADPVEVVIFWVQKSRTSSENELVGP